MDFVFKATIREDLGKGASRRLRRSGSIPAILYGADKEAVNLELNHNEVLKLFNHEGVYSNILTIDINGKKENAILRDVQRHPYKPLLSHLDFLRINAKETLRVNVPLRFINEENCVGVKQEGGQISHLLNSVEISVLPKNLPEFIEVDVAELKLGETLHLSNLNLPAGTEIVALQQGHDEGIVSVIHMRGEDKKAEASE